METIKVLIVDDEEIVVQGIKKGLEQDPLYSVSTTLGGESSVQLCKNEHFDVVLVDLVMPGINGVETCREIKKVSPDTEVLLISGFPRELEKYQTAFAEAGGRDFFLRKPVMTGEIADIISKIMKEKGR